MPASTPTTAPTIATPAPTRDVTTPAAQMPPAADDVANRIRGRLMAQSLMHLLDRVRGAREVLPHLAALERALLEHGAAAIAQVPQRWLGRICSQLASLPLPDDPPLHELLTCLTGTLGDQRRVEFSDAAETEASHMVVVREIGHSQYDAARAEMSTTLHGD